MSANRPTGAGDGAQGLRNSGIAKRLLRGWVATEEIVRSGAEHKTHEKRAG